MLYTLNKISIIPRIHPNYVSKSSGSARWWRQNQSASLPSWPQDPLTTLSFLHDPSYSNPTHYPSP